MTSTSARPRPIWHDYLANLAPPAGPLYGVVLPGVAMQWLFEPWDPTKEKRPVPRYSPEECYTIVNLEQYGGHVYNLVKTHAPAASPGFWDRLHGRTRHPVEPWRPVMSKSTTQQQKERT